MKAIYSSKLRICLVALFFTLFTGAFVKGQDIIVQKNGDEIKAKVEQILDTEIKYKKPDNLTGPLYTVKKADVFMIRYGNGTKDVFGDQPVTPSAEKAPVKKINISDKDLQPARNATILGEVLVIPILGLGITAGAIYGNPGVTIPLGAAATVIAGIGIPLVANLSGKTQKSTGVEGNPGLRFAGWVGYGLAMADAAILLGLALGDVTIAPGATYSVAVLASLASILMAIEANQTYSQAKSLRTTSRIQPSIGIIRDFNGNQYPSVGFKINF